MQKSAADRRYRVINLELMTTNLSQGRPYRMPFLDAPEAARIGGTAWLFCASCLAAVLPDRVVTQLVIDAAPHTAEDGRCRWHQTPLQPLPPQWFSDGGITSNFPIHFFDSRLPHCTGN